jgi:hypothetical protein
MGKIDWAQKEGGEPSRRPQNQSFGNSFDQSAQMPVQHCLVAPLQSVQTACE